MKKKRFRKEYMKEYYQKYYKKNKEALCGYQRMNRVEIYKVRNKNPLNAERSSKIYRKNQSNSLSDKKRNLWTDDEISFLRENYQTMTQLALAQALNRTFAAVTKKLHRLELFHYHKKI